MQPMIRHIRAPAGNRLRRTRRIGCRDSSIDHIVTVSSPTMHPRTSRIRPDMARTASSNSTKPRKSKDNGSTHDGETKVQPELDLEPEPLWKKILLAIPRAFGSGVRAVTGVGEYDPAYRRDGLCFLLLVLAVLFCASEWFRVSGPFGRLLHAIAAGVLGLMSVVLPVLLAAVAFRLMRNSGKGSNNPRVVTGWVLLMWSICCDRSTVGDHRRPHRIRHPDSVQSASGLFGFFLRLTARLGPFQRVRHHHFRGRRPVLLADDYRHPRHRFAGGCAQNRR